MYSNAPRIPGRGLGTAMLAGFLGWLVAIALFVGIAEAFTIEQLGTAWIWMLLAAFVLPVGLSPWLVRPTSFGVPVVFAVLSFPGWPLAYELRSGILAVTGGGSPGEELRVLGERLASPLHYFFGSGFPVPSAVVAVLVFLSSLGAVLVGRSHARRAAPTGPSPVDPYASGRGTFAPQAYPQGQALGQPPSPYPPGPPPAYGLGPGYGPPAGPPPGPAAPPTGPAQGSGGTRRLDPGE